MTIHGKAPHPTPGGLAQNRQDFGTPEKNRREIGGSESGVQADERRLNVLLDADGVVHTPARLAPWVRSLVAADLVAMRRSGRVIRGLDVLEFLDALDSAAALSENGRMDSDIGRIDVDGEILNSTLAAKVLECDPRTVRRVFKEGKLRGTKLGHEWFTTRSDLDDYRYGRGKGNGETAGEGD